MSLNSLADKVRRLASRVARKLIQQPRILLYRLLSDVRAQSKLRPDSSSAIAEHTLSTFGRRVLKRVILGRGSAISSRSFVVQDIVAGGVAGGNPARVIKEIARYG